MEKVVMKKSRLLRKIVTCRLLGVILTFIGTASAFVGVFAKDGTPMQTITTAAIVAVVAFVCGLFFLQMGGCQLFSSLPDVRPVVGIANQDLAGKTRMS